MMLCLYEGRNDPQGLERVLPVLDRRLYDGGVVFHAGLLAVFPCVDWRPGEQFVQAFLHLRPHILPDVPLMSLVDGVPQEVSMSMLQASSGKACAV